MLTADIKGKPVEEILDACRMLRIEVSSVIIFKVIAQSNVRSKSDTRALWTVMLLWLATVVYGNAVLTIFAVIPIFPGIK
jgi:hypothetical protein